MTRYYAIHDGDKLGPFTLEELAQLAAQGAMARGGEVEDSATGARLPLSALLPEPPPTAAPLAAPVAEPAAPTAALPPREAPAAVDLAAPPRFYAYLRWLWTAFLAIAGLLIFIRRSTPLHAIDLLMHEGGHMVFSLFGQFLSFLGGTIVELAIPCAVAVFFARQGKTAGAQFGFFWLGEALIDVSIYAADARALQLELLGGDHDWNYMLYTLGILEHDQTVAACFTVLAGLAFAAAVCWPLLARIFGKKAERAASTPSAS